MNFNVGGAEVNYFGILLGICGTIIMFILLISMAISRGML